MRIVTPHPAHSIAFPAHFSRAVSFIFLFLAIFITPCLSQGRTYKTVYPFNGPDGKDPEGDLVVDHTGNLYGTTFSGGTSNFGTVFKITPDRQQTTLYNFDYQSGAAPAAGLVLDNAGTLYGTASGGGLDDCLPGGCGVVFKIDAAGVYSPIHFFNESDGATPLGTLILDAAGNLYGTTRFGGTSRKGTVFMIDPSSTLTTLYSFSGGEDGESPFAGLVADANGNLYGTTWAGGGPFNFGTVFRIDPSGNESILHRFSAFADGTNPTASLILDDVGNLYGTTSEGGTNGGTVFQLDPSGVKTILHSFRSADGKFPHARLLRDLAGNLYGTTRLGGRVGAGTVFRLEPSGRLRVLHTFLGGNDRGFPDAGLVRDTIGNLYGVASRGGPTQSGSVFRISR